MAALGLSNKHDGSPAQLLQLRFQRVPQLLGLGWSCGRAGWLNGERCGRGTPRAWSEEAVGRSVEEGDGEWTVQDSGALYRLHG